MNAVHVVFEQDTEPVAVTTAADLDALLDRIAADAPPDAPPLVALDLPEHHRSLVVGLRSAVGVLNYLDLDGPGGSVSKARTDGVSTPPYFYCGHWTGLPDDAEIPAGQVRAAAHEFLTTGRRPTCVDWQQ